MPDMKIQTPRLVLDALRPDDAAALFACRGDPSVARYQGWQPASVDEAAEFIVRQAAVPFGGAGTWCQRAIRRRDSGELIGDLGIHFPPTNEGAVELGISLTPAQQGHGYAREAMAAAVDLVFSSLDYRRVVGSVDPRNRASVALLRALGFRQEAHHVESLRVHGEWVDDAIYALLAREWRAASTR